MSASPCCRDVDPLILQVSIPVHGLQHAHLNSHRVRRSIPNNSAFREELVVVMQPGVSTQAIEHCDQNKAVTTEDLGGC